MNRGFGAGPYMVSMNVGVHLRLALMKHEVVLCYFICDIFQAKVKFSISFKRTYNIFLLFNKN